ncbi:MAG: CehA/McbA family metallohydrolase [Acidobacteriales bacterium]|nr:CehA/McbA family metallohydrolase [Terriglobales bacterium]
MRILRFYSFVVVSCMSVLAQRDPVLKQINLPHPYYYREMYLPQLTSGPSAAAWSRDSKTLYYSMEGSLWQQRIDSPKAEELIAGPGYNYQPDCSPDGRWLVFTRYDHDALELWALELATRRARQLTAGGAVNIEPRFSPDGTRLAFVSTSYHGHFHIFVGRFQNGELSNVGQLTAEHVSPLPRYYYSRFDHEISPVWSRDGSEILFVSNRGHIHGTGGFWRMKAQPGAEGHEIHYEETNWKARPDFSPDGTRMVYASYMGRAWHQLWVMPASGGDAFPISYGDFDNINPRWAPDGSKIAFISNRSGNTSLWVQSIPGGAQTEIVARSREYLRPMGQLRIRVLHPDGKLCPSRLFVTAEDGRAYAPDTAWIAADDSFDRHERAFEAHYFDSNGESELKVPSGRVEIGVMRGFEFQFERQRVEIEPGKTTEVEIKLRPVAWKHSEDKWASGDVHVHMNYAGTYRNTPAHLVEQAAAENLSFIENLVVNKEQRFPDIAYFSTALDPASTAEQIIQHSQEFHTSYWGHLGLLNLTRNLILPGYAGYPNTAAASLFPSNADVADLAHDQGALVGYVHPLDELPDPAKEEITNELPIDVALGKVDYIEVLGFSDHKSTAEVWYKLLNCGFRLPAAAGTDFMGNFASLRGPAGLNRVYAQVPPGALDIQSWLRAIKSGRTFATNGPLLRFELGGQSPGGEVRVAAAQTLTLTAAMGSIVPVDHLQIICNGRLARELPLSTDRTTAYLEDRLTIDRGGWCLLRAFSDRAEFPVLDIYPYATTSPIYINMPGSRWTIAADAQYFVDWTSRVIAGAQSSGLWNSDEEKQNVVRKFDQARRIFEKLAAR